MSEKHETEQIYDDLMSPLVAQLQITRHHPNGEPQ